MMRLPNKILILSLSIFSLGSHSFAIIFNSNVVEQILTLIARMRDRAFIEDFMISSSILHSYKETLFNLY